MVARIGTVNRLRGPQLWPAHGKPRSHQVELNRQAPLARELRLLMMMNFGPYADKARVRALALSGAAYSFGMSPYGPTMFASNVNSNLVPSPLIHITTAFTISVLHKIAASSSNFQVWAELPGLLSALYFDTGANTYGSDVGGSAGATALTGWHRVTFVQDSAANLSKFYINGLASGSTSTAGAINADFGQVFGDGVYAPFYPAVDMFIWNRALSAQEVAVHNGDPYGTVLRPKWPEHFRAGSTAAAAAKTPYNFANNSQPILVQ